MLPSSLPFSLRNNSLFKVNGNQLYEESKLHITRCISSKWAFVHPRERDLFLILIPIHRRNWILRIQTLLLFSESNYIMTQHQFKNPWVFNLLNNKLKESTIFLLTWRTLSFRLLRLFWELLKCFLFSWDPGPRWRQLSQLWTHSVKRLSTLQPSVPPVTQQFNIDKQK